MSLIDYDFGLLSTAEQDVQSSVSRIISRVDELNNSVRQLQSVWQSTSAAPAYANLMRNWDTMKEQLLLSVQKFGTAIGDSGREMNTTENTNTQALGG
ncbi:WXG100 family type VII secretion target [Amycolatopsis taiwanensis]|uniref:ESAT-6-like protein n=1 Tax=Amycolatopsis taiwanensis TaxID=342230 RepID=A0A9W6QZL6_9PSEU|nr:WXG100 family type VII secretion target [Amycolatopsis taiwanensis]GLY65836.1 hypothetical protein Atai01_24550 [Amycolatopsis taiwanensis]